MHHLGDEDTIAAGAETKHLWLQALAELDPRRADRSWYPTADDLARSLCAAAEDDRSLLSLINQALVLQQFLLETFRPEARFLPVGLAAGQHSEPLGDVTGDGRPVGEPDEHAVGEGGHPGIHVMNATATRATGPLPADCCGRPTIGR